MTQQLCTTTGAAQAAVLQGEVNLFFFDYNHFLSQALCAAAESQDGDTMQTILFSQLEPGQKFRITLNTAAHIDPDDMFYIADVENHVVFSSAATPLKSYSRRNITRQLREAGLVLQRD